MIARFTAPDAKSASRSQVRRVGTPRRTLKFVPIIEQRRRLSWLIFLTAFIAFGYFQSGGGWNQNARFAMVRAMAERGEFSIDSYLIYARAKADASTQLRRIPVINAEYDLGGQHWLLMWPNKTEETSPVHSLTEGPYRAANFSPVPGRLEGKIAAIDQAEKTIEVEDTQKVRIPIVFSSATKIERGGASISSTGLRNGDSVQVVCGLDRAARVEAKIISLLDPDHPPMTAFTDLGPVASTGDVAFYRGHFYPNKAPGTSFTGLPIYWLIFHLEKIAGANPDDWWALTINAWLTSLFSVGIISALGVALFFQLAFEFSNGSFCNSLAAVGILAFGTMFFPNATLFYEHNLIAVALLASFYFLYRVKTAHVLNPQRNALTKKAVRCIFLAGLCAGWAAITNYIFAIAVVLLAVYLVLSVERKTALVWFGLGLLGPFLLICAYNVACFDTAFTTNYQHQNPSFEAGPTYFLGVFNLPRWDVLLIILFSPYRGLFFTAPVLIMSIFGLVAWIRDTRFRSEAVLILAIFLFCLLWNASFNGWDGGVTAVPRYLGPAIPFLTLALLYSLARFFKTTCALAGASAAIMLLVTAVDIQPPIGTGAAVVLDKPQWRYDPVFEYDLPIFFAQKPLPLLRQQEAQVLHHYDLQLARESWKQPGRNQELDRIRAEIDRKIAEGKPAPLLLARFRNDSTEEYLVGDSELCAPVGPVSAHNFGFYGHWSDDGFGGPASPQARWNSFNIGEALFPESRWSLLPLLVFIGLATWQMGLIARTSEPNVRP